MNSDTRSAKYPGVRRRGNSYEVEVYDPALKTKRRFTVKTATSFAEAAKEQVRLKAELGKGRKLVSATEGRVTVAELAGEWLEAKTLSGKVGERTVTRYAQHVAHIQHPTRGIHKPIRDLEHDDCQAFVHRLTRAGLAPKTVGDVTAILGQILKWTRARKKLLTFDPLEMVERPTRPDIEKPPPAVSAIHAAMDAAIARGEPDRATIIALFAATGVRDGELAAIQVADVQLDRDPPQIRITKQIPDRRARIDHDGQRRAPSREPARPKSRAGVRTFALDRDTVAMLRQHLDWSAARAAELGYDTLPEGSYLFWPYRAAPKRADGPGFADVATGPLKPYSPASIRKMFRTLTGIGGLRPHQLRHFHASHLAANGVPVVEMMGRLGWASSASAKPYIHWMKARDQEAAEAIGDVLRRRDGNVVPIASKRKRA